jgi:diguanylate cyclase (GGDEF)-like protein
MSFWRGEGFMDNVVAISIYVPMLAIIIAIFISAISDFLKTKRNIMYVYLCICVIGWLITEITAWFINDVRLELFILNLTLIFVGFAPLVFFLFFFQFYFPKRKLCFAPLLFIIPVINIFIAFTSNHHSLLIINNEAMDFTFGMWFIVHSVFCYILTFAGAATVAYGYLRKPKFYRFPSIVLIIAIVALIGGSFAFITGFWTIDVNTTLIGTCIALIIVHFAIISNEQSLFIRYARGHVFRYLEDYVLVLNNAGMIADSNANATQWLTGLGLYLKSCSLQELLSKLEQNGATVSSNMENEDGQDIYIVEDGFPRILNLRIHDITDNKGNVNGSVAIIADVTQNRTLIERLEKNAGIDYLTGLANRTTYSGAKIRLESAEHLPLGVIICDIDGLKTVNDTLGHKYGDMLIQNIAEVLKQVKPEPYFCARIGGDEFIFLMPHTNPGQAYGFMQKIKKALAKRNNLPFTLSLSMGAAVKQNEAEDLEEIITLADQRMYIDKKRLINKF